MEWYYNFMNLLFGKCENDIMFFLMIFFYIFLALGIINGIATIFLGKEE